MSATESLCPETSTLFPLIKFSDSFKLKELPTENLWFLCLDITVSTEKL